MQSLLPLYGLAHGLDDAGAARLVAVFSLGEAVLVAGARLDGRPLRPRSHAARRASSRRRPAAPARSPSAAPLLLRPVLFLAGGTIAGIYTLGVILIGQDFRGQRLAVVSTGFAMAYSAGSIVGSTPVGYLIDLFGPEALPVSIAVGFLGLTVYLFWRKRIARPETEGERSEVDLPEITFDLSFLNEWTPVDVEDPEAGDLDVDYDRERQESDLQRWFHQRAAEIARRAAEREQRLEEGSDRLEAQRGRLAAGRREIPAWSRCPRWISPTRTTSAA